MVCNVNPLFNIQNVFYKLFKKVKTSLRCWKNELHAQKLTSNWTFNLILHKKNTY